MTSCKWRYFTHNHTSASWLGYRFSLGSPKSIKIHPLGTMNAYTHFRANPLCRYLTGYTKTLTWWWHNRKLLGNGKVIRIHPLETMDIWTKFHGHPLSRGRKITHIMYTWSGNARTHTHTHSLSAKSELRTEVDVRGQRDQWPQSCSIIPSASGPVRLKQAGRRAAAVTR